RARAGLDRRCRRRARDRGAAREESRSVREASADARRMPPRGDVHPPPAHAAPQSRALAGALARAAAPMSDLFRLDGRVAFGSGAAGHLGSAMSRALCEAGAHVILNGRDEARLRDFEGELRCEGHAVARAAFDVADFATSRAFFAGLARLDILVN